MKVGGASGRDVSFLLLFCSFGERFRAPSPGSVSELLVNLLELHEGVSARHLELDQQFAALDLEDCERAEKIRRRFAALENLRNSQGPIPVLHEAVRLAGIADTGPMWPLMTNLPEILWDRVQSAALELKQYNEE